MPATRRKKRETDIIIYGPRGSFRHITEPAPVQELLDAYGIKRSTFERYKRLVRAQWGRHSAK